MIIFEGDVTVGPPPLPQFLPPPVDPDIIIVPVGGPVGPAGAEGPEGPPGASAPGALTQEDLTTHIDDPEPHPAYDDGPTFTLLYENAKV